MHRLCSRSNPDAEPPALSHVDASAHHVHHTGKERLQPLPYKQGKFSGPHGGSGFFKASDITTVPDFTATIVFPLTFILTSTPVCPG